MDTSKIPWVECVITLPEQIEDNLNKLLSIYKKNSRSKKKIKKKLNRITTDKIINEKNLLDYENDINNNLLEYDDLKNNLNGNENKKLISLSDEDMFSQLELLMLNTQKIPNKLESKIIDYINIIIKKYMNIYLHKEDQTYLISEKNKENNKIFLKFYFPRIKNDNNDISVDNRINKFGDNIHFTVLPEIFGHGKDGMFHLTFRIESKKGKPLYEYSKYVSFNIIDEKVGIVLYDDEKGNNSVIFKISNNLQELNNFIAGINNFSDGLQETLNTEVFKDICLYIALDIFKKLFSSKKIDNFFTRYLNSFGLETIYKMINKLLSILLSTFLNMYAKN